MASINEKINYINETKSLIKDRLNDLGSEINNETTFREYAEKIENLYEEWPKITEENTIIKLNNTKNGKIDMALKGNTTQYNTTGINLIGSKAPFSSESNGIKRSLNEDGSLTFYGTASNNTYVTFTNNLTLKSNTTYTTFIQDRNMPSGTNLYYNDCGNVGLAYADLALSSGNRVKTYTTGTVTGTVSIGILINNGASVNFTIYPMLVEGTVTASSIPDYEPYTGGITGPNPTYPQDIKTVTGGNTISICGKNLLDSSTIKQNMYVCPCKKGDSFVFSFTGLCSSNDKRIFLRTAKGDFSNSFDNCIDSQTITLTDTSASYTKTITSTTDGFVYIRTAAGISNYTLSNLMVEKGSTATTYEEYQGQDYEIDLGKNILDLSDFKNITSNGITLIPIVKNGKLLYIFSEGQYSQDTYLLLTNTQKIKPNTVYTLSGAYSPSARLRLREYDINGNNLSEYFDSGFGVTFTSKPDVEYVNVQIVFYAQNDDAIFYPMLEQNNQVTTYCPYKNPISLLKIGTYQDNFIKDNNLFNKNVEIKEAYPYTTIGVAVSYNDSDKTYSYVNCCKVKKDKTYTIAYNQNTPSATADRYGVIVNKNNIVLQQQLTWRNNTPSITFTPSYDGYLIMSTDKNATDIQINEGSIVLPYEQYNTNQWYLKREIGKMIVTGESTLNGFSTHSGTTYITVNVPQADAKRVNENQIGTLCDKLKGTTIGKTWNGNVLNSCSLPSNGNYIQICLPYSVATTENDLRTWLDNNNLTIYYWLSTPTYTKVTEDLSIQLENLSKAHSYNKQTNILQNNDNMPFIITASTLEKNSN